MIKINIDINININIDIDVDINMNMNINVNINMELFYSMLYGMMAVRSIPYVLLMKMSVRHKILE